MTLLKCRISQHLGSQTAIKDVRRSLVSSLMADVGGKLLLINEVASKFESWDSYRREIESHVGPSGFSLFATIDHGAWIKKVGIRRKALRLIIGNPTAAITMLRHDLTAGLLRPSN